MLRPYHHCPDRQAVSVVLYRSELSGPAMIEPEAQKTCFAHPSSSSDPRYPTQLKIPSMIALAPSFCAFTTTSVFLSNEGSKSTAFFSKYSSVLEQTFQ
jgi:hypothetical protein